MKSLGRPELPTASVGSSQATTATVDNSAPLATRPESIYKPKSGSYPVNASGSGGSQGGGGRVIFATPSSTNAFQRLAWGNCSATDLT